MEEEINSKKYRKAIFIVAYKKTKKGFIYLVLKRKLHWRGWEFPKGGVEKWETKKMAVKREIKEETGLKAKKIKNHKINGYYDYIKNLPERPYSGQSYQLYSVELPKGKINMDEHEHKAYKWLSFENATKIITWKNQKDCLKIVNEYLTKKNRKREYLTRFISKPKFSQK